MKNNVAIVTRASRGIGAAIAEKLALNRWVVVGFDTSWKETSIYEVICRQVVDIVEYENVSEAIELVERTVGPVGLVVNNAGITRDTACHKMKPEDFEAVLRVNLIGAFHLCRATLSKMRHRMFGRIVNISSMNAVRGQIGQANYVAAKVGLIAMTKSIALENASRNITANWIAPGFIRSRMTDAMRAGVLDRDGSYSGRPNWNSGGRGHRGCISCVEGSELHYWSGSLHGGQVMS